MPIAFLLRWSEIKEKKGLQMPQQRIRCVWESDNIQIDIIEHQMAQEKESTTKKTTMYASYLIIIWLYACVRMRFAKGITKVREKKYARIVHMLKFVTVCLILLPFSHRTHTHFSFARWFFFSFVMLLLFNTNTRTIFKLRWILCILIYETIHSHRYFYLYGVQLNEKKK